MPVIIFEFISGDSATLDKEQGFAGRILIPNPRRPGSQRCTLKAVSARVLDGAGGGPPGLGSGQKLWG